MSNYEIENLLSEIETFEEIQSSNVFQSFVEDNNEENEYEEEEENEQFDDDEANLSYNYNEFDDFERDNEIIINNDGNKDCFSQCSLMIFDLEKKYSVPCIQEGFRRLQQCVGVCEINSNIVKDAGNELEKLAVCKNHFNLDQTSKYHPTGIKQNKSYVLSKILTKRCLCCYKIFNIYSRGNYCEEHFWQVINKNLLTSCICQFTCSSFTNEILSKKLNNITNTSLKSQYICQECYYKNEGHIYISPGQGNKPKACSHQNDSEKILKKIGSWILNIANSNNFEEKQRLLYSLLPSLAAYWNEDSQESSLNLPSIFLINIILKLKGVDKLHEEQKYNLNPDESFRYGEFLGNFILKNKNNIKKNKEQLTNPTSINEYYKAFPQVITRFFDGFIGILLNYHYIIAQKRRKYLKPNVSKTYKEQDSKQLIKITIFLSSIILTIAFRKTKFWLTNLFASLCRRSQFLGSLQAILRSVYIISHTEAHERRLEIQRMKQVNPKSRIKTGSHIWPLAVIDNLDTIQKSYKHNNYYNEARNTFHVTLRILFLFVFPLPLNYIVNPQALMLLNEKRTLFGFTSFSLEIIDLFEYIFKKLLNYQILSGNIHFNQVNDEKIYQEILKYLPKGTFILSPEVIILEAGGKPNDDEGIYESIEMFLDEVDLTYNKFLDIAADQSIFERIINYKKYINPNIHFILGQWHTNKDMCSVLINIFSGYGIFNLGKALGAKYLTNFQKIVDYRATSKLLELIWIVVGMALSIFTIKHQVSINELLKNLLNKFIKVWILYWKWTSLLRAHKLGIRTGNWDMQIESLSAFAPLFPVASKVKYATSVCHFLSLIDKDPQFATILRYISSINLTRTNHYLGFDEALETYGVKFVKQFLTKRIIDEESLKLQIKSIQDEYERMDAFIFEFLDTKKTKKDEHKINLIKEPLWKLVDDLLSLFENFNLNTEHYLLEMTPELTTNGFDSLFNCYNIGKERIESLLKQEVYETEPINSTECRLSNVKIYKYEKLIELYSKKKGKQPIKKTLGEVYASTGESSNSNNNIIDLSVSIEKNENISKRKLTDSSFNEIEKQKKQKRITTSQEHVILDPLVEMNDKPSKDQINDALVKTGWDRKRLVDYIYQHRKKKDQQKQ